MSDLPSNTGNRRTALSMQADAIAKALSVKPRAWTWDDLRECIDTRTGGDLDCQPLDILTDMVQARLAKRFWENMKR